MALRGFRCPECHTWFEGEGNHPRCPLCGKRSSPRDLITQRPDRGSAPDAFPPAGYETPQPDFEVPSRETRDYEAPEWDADSFPPPEPELQRTEDPGKSWSDRIGPLIGVTIFVALIASRLCRELTNSE